MNSAAPPPSVDRRDAWTRYWQGGALHSLEGSFAGNYEGAISSFWDAAFTSIPDQGRVIDICTGNGSIPQMLCTIRGGSAPYIDAVDLAQPAAGWLEQLPASLRQRIRFHGGTNAEHLPFDSSTYDLAVSQFGIEYTRLDESVAEVARVLRQGGMFAAVMHHSDSRITEVSREEVRLAALLLGEDGLLAMARGLYPWMQVASEQGGSALNGHKDADCAKAGYNTAMRELSHAIDQSHVPDLLHEVRDVVNAHMYAISNGHAKADQALESNLSLCEHLRLSAFRNAEVGKYAIDGNAMESLIDRMAGHGLRDASAVLIRESGYLLGWGLRATKA